MADPRQKNAFMAPVRLQSRQKSASMASVITRGQKALPFGLAPICLGSKIEVELRKQHGPKVLTALVSSH